MLPKSPNEESIPTRMIYINPNFNKVRAMTHINPNFLRPRTETTTTSIHLNPQFIQKKFMEQQQQILLQQFQLQEQQKIMTQIASTTLASEPQKSNAARSTVNLNPNASCKLIPKSSMSIVRKPLKKSEAPAIKAQHVVTPTKNPSPMIKVGSRKLLRRSLLRTTSISKKFECNEKSIPAVTVTSTQDKYKIDRRRLRSLSLTNVSSLARIRRRSFVGRFALRRTSSLINTRRKCSSSNDNTKSTTASLKQQFKHSAVPSNKSLQMLNINGVLYKSTRTKLQRNDNYTNMTLNSPTPQIANTNMPSLVKRTERSLIVRGTRFVLDKNGFKLTRVVDKSHPNQQIPSLQHRPHMLKRIDIGGLTYVANSQNVLVRTGNHLARTHLNNAKHKSLQVLSRSLVKSNIPCPIFQRVGKCAAFERGKCRKVHDKRHVAICSRFLRGECMNDACLLSHSVSLSKMPVCKFFLQGICGRPDCPYLHKKFSQSTEVCSDFLRGFCRLAEKCNKRHEFLCTEYEKKGKCEKTNCLYCKRKAHLNKGSAVKLKEKPVSSTQPLHKEEVNSGGRYFVNDTIGVTGVQKAKEPEMCDENYCNKIEGEEEILELTATTCNSSRPKLGALPAYIPLK